MRSVLSGLLISQGDHVIYSKSYTDSNLQFVFLVGQDALDSQFTENLFQSASFFLGCIVKVGQFAIYGYLTSGDLRILIITEREVDDTDAVKKLCESLHLVSARNLSNPFYDHFKHANEKMNFIDYEVTSIINQLI
ncbi:hypothetical protein GJ496_005798 [Pomphorhynchus laevis]|nr:hypothetical protein GJ496_005798 [Pomphorhynchus laevis]